MSLNRREILYQEKVALSRNRIEANRCVTLSKFIERCQEDCACKHKYVDALGIVVWTFLDF